MSASVKNSFYQQRIWQVAGLVVGLLFIGYLLFMVSQPKPGSSDAQINNLQIEIRQLKRYVQQLQQQALAAEAQVADLESLTQVQQQVIKELRFGNEQLQAKLYAVEKDIVRYREALGSK